MMITSESALLAQIVALRLVIVRFACSAMSQSILVGRNLNDADKKKGLPSGSL